MSARRAAIFGSTGLVGGFLLKRLLDDDGYARVAAPSRSPLRIQHPKLAASVIDFERLKESAPLFAADDIFCCLGTTRAQSRGASDYRRVDFDYPLEAARLARQAGARRFFLVSSIGADARSAFKYLRVKGEIERALASLGFQAVKIFRPSLIVGERARPRLNERLTVAFYRAFPFLFTGRLRKARPIRAEDIAAAMHAVARRDVAGFEIFESDAIQSIADEGRHG